MRTLALDVGVGQKETGVRSAVVGRGQPWWGLSAAPSCPSARALPDCMDAVCTQKLGSPGPAASFMENNQETESGVCDLPANPPSQPALC